MISELLASKAFATLTFLGLSANPAESNIQKSLLMQSLRAAFPAPSAFIEESAETDFAVEASSEHHRLTLRCITCFKSNEGQTIDPESVTYTSSDRQSSPGATGSASINVTSEYEFSFKLQAKSEETASARKPETQKEATNAEAELWRVALSIKKLNFGIFTDRKIERGEQPAVQFFRIVPCLTSAACVAAKTFPSLDAANTTVQKEFGARMARSAIAAGRQVDTGDFVEPTLVERGAPVTVSLESPTGLTIKTKGVALRSGSSGEIIPVQLNLGFQKDAGALNTQTVQTRITAKGEVRYER